MSRNQSNSGMTASDLIFLLIIGYLCFKSITWVVDRIMWWLGLEKRPDESGELEDLEEVDA